MGSSDQYSLDLFLINSMTPIPPLESPNPMIGLSRSLISVDKEIAVHGASNL